MSVRRVLFIINPISGGGEMSDLVRDVSDRLAARGFYVRARRTASAGDATTIAAGAADDTHAVVAVGGDGTVREVVEGLIERPIPVLVIPGGTENLLAREFHMGKDPARIVDTLENGQPRTCDVGVLNDRHFLIMVGVGFDADVVERLTRRRTGHISRLSYCRPIWDSLWNFTFPTLRVEIDGSLVFDGNGLVFVGQLPCNAANLRVTPDAVPDDGLLDVCILPGRTRTRLAMHVWRIFRRTHVGSNGVISMRGNRLRVASPERTPVQCDGDFAGVLPIDVSVRPAAARFLVLRDTAH